MIAAVLNSRQSKRPCALDSWIVGTNEAAKHLVASGFTVITSIGLNTWELVVHLVNRQGGRQIIIVPDCDQSSVAKQIPDIVSDFELDSKRCRFISLDQGEPPTGRGSPAHARDAAAVALADRLIPVAIRPHGYLDELIRQAVVGGKAVNDDYRRAYRGGVDRPAYNFRDTDLNPEVVNVGRDYLTHWTRSSHHPFPGELKADFYERMLNLDHYPASAFETLKRIVRENRLRASGRFIRGQFKVVSFTALAPRDALSLMRWRRRYVYFNFEPYGVCVRREAARAAGARAVIYGCRDVYSILPESLRHLYQNEGGKYSDWRPEAEYRVFGDLDLATFPGDSVMLITLSRAEARELQELSRWRVVSLLAH
jgi:hypothetical protein